jgi:Tfp pilus assembly protein PilF/16S rRNA G966 N2-methylase RsmD
MTDSQMAVERLLGQAVSAYGAGDCNQAAVHCREVLSAQPNYAAAHNLMGLVAFATEDSEGAVVHLGRAATLEPSNAEYSNNLGVVLHALGQFAEAGAAFEGALAADPTLAHAANNLGAIREKLNDDAGAIASYHSALRMDPAYLEARQNLLLACTRVAPHWHFPMMADARRNAAYAEALRRAAPGRRVLDIGTGSGLLAMLAVSSGAASVTACEMQPVIAGLAEEIVRRNGLAERIAVHAKKSDQLEIGRDMEQLAEVLVTETFASGLVSEGVLPTLEDAHRRLLTPEAIVIPMRAAAVGYLVGGEMIEDHLFAARSTGYDLSPFDVVAPVKLGLHLDRVPHLPLSNDFEILSFDLRHPPFPAERRVFEVAATAAGRCVGVAQWLRLDLDDRVTYDNRPSPRSGANGWMHVVYRFAEPVEVRPGDLVKLICSHNRLEMTVGLFAAAGQPATAV